MKKLQLPSSYAVLSEEEQRTVSGGGELKDSLDEFLGSLHLHDFTLGEGLVSFSVTFVPMLLFTAVKNVVLFGYRVYNKLLASSIFRLGTSTSETVPASCSPAGDQFLPAALSPFESKIEKGLLQICSRPFFVASAVTALVLRPVPAAGAHSSCPGRTPAPWRYGSAAATFPAHRPEWCPQSRRPASAMRRCCPAGCSGSTQAPPTALMPDIRGAVHILAQCKGGAPAFQHQRGKIGKAFFQQSPALGQRAGIFFVIVDARSTARSPQAVRSRGSAAQKSVSGT